MGYSIGVLRDTQVDLLSQKNPSIPNQIKETGLRDSCLSSSGDPNGKEPLIPPTTGRLSNQEWTC